MFLVNAIFLIFILFGASIPMLTVLILLEIFGCSRVWAACFIGLVWVGIGYLWLDHRAHPDFSTPMSGFGDVFLSIIIGGAVMGTALYGGYLFKTRER